MGNRSSSPALLDLPLPDHRHLRSTWGQLYGAGPALAIAESLRRHQGPVCIIAANASGVDRLISELGFFAPDQTVLHFPDYETLPYEAISAPQELLSERLYILHSLATAQPIRLILHAEALLNRLPPAEFVRSRSLSLAVGQSFDRDARINELVTHGYLRVERVSEPGEFAVRGAVIDIFPSGRPEPVRIDLFDDEIENLRVFDPSTQISTGSIDRLRVLPAREFPFDAAAITGFRQRFRDEFPVEPGRAAVYRDISEALIPAGIEYYMPLFFDATSSLVDYLGTDALVIQTSGTADSAAAGWAMIEQRFTQMNVDDERPLLEPHRAFHEPARIAAALERHQRVDIQTYELEETDGHVANAGTGHPLTAGLAADLDAFEQWLDATAQERTLLVTSSAGRRELIIQLLQARKRDIVVEPDWNAFVSGSAHLSIGVADLEDGLRLPAFGLNVLTAEQLGLEKPRQRLSRRRRSARDPDAIVRELTDLQSGAPVVHEDYGIGRYRGLATLELDDVPMEFLLLEYADGDKLYVPVSSLHLVSRYTGASAEHAPLHRLGSDQWHSAKRKAAEKARDVAAELLHLYAKRAARDGTSMSSIGSGYEMFTAAFPFEETEDQQRVIDDVLEDLAQARPMDRIVCGDVGFGKTEVALRSAFVAVNSGFQVAVLVPTTLLAQQHFRTFSDRFADWPISVRLLSRFNTSVQASETNNGIRDGTVDIVIGTHKLLQRGIEFKRLGLVIVDEEHRFGVRHKEQLKRLKADVDLLTLTATPIPRTLNMSLGGLRDLSIIATPPADRLSVKTFVGEWNDVQIRDAVLRELRRGGQVYFVHNRVEDIERIADRLRNLLPESQIRTAHGQMSESLLESVMVDFYHRRFNVLVCTTIIESGIDIPTANTMIINRADRLGLAQLHQLRGRVGRSHHQAYAYMLAPPLRALTADARKRLEAIEALEQLGSGFTLATHDLEIRGAGELLGEGQSGQIQAVGFTLYNELLARAVRELREGRAPDLDDPFVHGPEIDAGVTALIPEDYMPDVHTRLVHYKRVASAASQDALERLQIELIDRFGLLPESTKTLFAVTALKLLAQGIGITRVRASGVGGSIEFGATASVDPELLVSLVTEESSRFKLDGPRKLRFVWDEPVAERRLDAIGRLLARLGATPVEPAAVESIA